MTATPKGYVLSSDATPQPLFTATVPTFIHAILVSSRADADVTLDWTDDDNGDAVTDICYNYPSKANDSVTPIAGGFTLDTGDVIRGRAGAAATVHVTIVSEPQE